ncbi:MAG: methyltransferase domain-containing protein [Myxococcales bacterium]|nr:MAG: methyltransferase domain-containing protein [Myxococcales bacterium]
MDSLHVDESELGPLLGACPVCGFSAERKPYVQLQSRPEVTLLRCDSCGGKSASRFPNESFLASLYDPQHYHSDLIESPRALARLASHIVKHLPVHLRKKELRIVDFGGSDGSLSKMVLEKLAAQGGSGKSTATVVDLYTKESSAQLRFIDVERFWQSTDRYDVVLASAVIEHLSNLPQVLSQLFEVCSPGGLFFARSPCDAPLQRFFPNYRVKWPRHLHDLGPEFWSKFPKTFGISGKVLRSAPSIVESDFSMQPVRTLLATALKFPAHVENAFIKPLLRYQINQWDLVGGWEYFFQVERTLARREHHKDEQSS